MEITSLTDSRKARIFPSMLEDGVDKWAERSTVTKNDNESEQHKCGDKWHHPPDFVGPHEAEQALYTVELCGKVIV